MDELDVNKRMNGKKHKHTVHIHKHHEYIKRIVRTNGTFPFNYLFCIPSFVS